MVYFHSKSTTKHGFQKTVRNCTKRRTSGMKKLAPDIKLQVKKRAYLYAILYFVCLYICVNECMHVCMHVCMYICICRVYV